MGRSPGTHSQLRASVAVYRIVSLKPSLEPWKLHDVSKARSSLEASAVVLRRRGREYERGDLSFLGIQAIQRCSFPQHIQSFAVVELKRDELTR